MATRGRKPKPAFLKLVTGNPGRRPLEGVPDEMFSRAGDNGLEPPRSLRKRQAELWAQFIRTAPWLEAHDAPRAAMWVELQVEFERKPTAMVAGRIAQLRALGSELGLDPASRARMGFGRGNDEKKDPTEKYFAA